MKPTDADYKAVGEALGNEPAPETDQLNFNLNADNPDHKTTASGPTFTAPLVGAETAVQARIIGTPLHEYTERPPRPPLTWRQRMAARWFWAKHYVFGVDLPCTECKYSVDMAQYQRIRDANRVYPIVCIEKHVREFHDPHGQAVVTPTCIEARRATGGCGRKPRWFARS